MDIRAFHADDTAAYRELRLLALQDTPQAFASSYEEEAERDLERFREWLGGPEGFVLGSFVAGELVGMLGLYRDRHVKMRHRGHIWGMFVRPEQRGRGHGRALLQEALRRARKLEGLLQVNLEVVTEQAAALALYESLGFRRYGTEARALIVAERAYDEALMVLPLDPSS